MAVSVANVNIFNKLQERQHLSVERWQRKAILGYCEDVLVRKMVKTPYPTKKLIFSGEGYGSIQAISISDDCQYMATGHTSSTHQIVVLALRPRIHIINTLLGHTRTPWCLTFDPSQQTVLYSGCVGGIIKKWNFESGCLLAEFDCRGHAPVTNIIALDTWGCVMVSTKLSIYLLNSQDLDVIWKAPYLTGTLRYAKYFIQERKLLTAKRQPMTARGCFLLQVVDYDDLNSPPDLNDISTGVICTCPLYSYRHAITSKLDVIYSRGAEVVCVKKTGLCPWIIPGIPSAEISFISVSPCERYLLVVERNKVQRSHYRLRLMDLETRYFVSAPVWEPGGRPVGDVNCAVWLPFTSPYPMALCVSEYGQLAFIT